jgi:hypothetical protein
MVNKEIVAKPEPIKKKAKIEVKASKCTKKVPKAEIYLK